MVHLRKRHLVSECTNCRGPAHGLEWTGTLWSLVPTIYRDMCTIVQIEIQVITNNVQWFIYSRGTLASECTNCRGPAHGLEWTGTLWSLVPTIYRDMCTIVQIKIQVITNNVQGFIYARGTLASDGRKVHVTAWDQLSDSRVSFGEGVTTNLIHIAILELVLLDLNRAA
ncbi:hypothetical protein J6590_020327 [Homalodisca vitripennis]|nr:hypothetical protein J6590_020327 [Homalodisca vitripennis]